MYAEKIYFGSSYVFIFGPGVAAAVKDTDRELTPLAPHYEASHPAGPLSYDDWPFLYLKERAVPKIIIGASVAVIISGFIILVFIFRKAFVFNRTFFFLGAGFLLIETKTIAQLALLFGTTWKVSAITIGLILIIIFIANLIIEKFGDLPRKPLYVLLGLSLILTYYIPANAALGLPVIIFYAVVLLQFLPFLCAGLIFSSLISTRRQLSAIIAVNLAGSVFGGLLENLCMVYGFSKLNIIAIIVYLLSF